MAGQSWMAPVPNARDPISAHYALYRRYANKGDLCLDLLREQFERSGAEIATLLAQAATAPALERLERVLAYLVQFLEAQGSMRGHPAGAERHEGQCSEADLSRHTSFQTTPWYRWLHELLAGLLTEAVEHGELAALDIPFTTDAMLAALHPAVYRFQRQERGFSSERIVQGLCHIYIDGVKAPPAPAERATNTPQFERCLEEAVVGENTTHTLPRVGGRKKWRG